MSKVEKYADGSLCAQQKSNRKKFSRLLFYALVEYSGIRLVCGM